MAVGAKHTDDPNVLLLPHAESRSPWSKTWWRAHDRLQELPVPGPAKRAGGWALRRVAEPLAAPKNLIGCEDFNYPGAKKLLELTPARPSLVHCHNLHGRYFDLHELPRISHEAPTVVTLHDIWLLTGHCAFSMGCSRFLTGCGHCPDLNIPPGILRDHTAANWQLKKSLYERSSVYLVTPCQWLMDLVEKSIFNGAVRHRRVIPYGIDQNVFRPGDRRAARTALGLPHDAYIVMTASNGVKSNVFKDFETLHAAAALLGKAGLDRRVILIGTGADEEREVLGNLTLKMVPFVEDRAKMAQYYQAADLFLHPSREETFPNVILEALACGIPVVATRVGGVPEQVRSLAWNASQRSTTVYGRNAATGIIVPARDPGALADAARQVLCDGDLRVHLAANASRDARGRYSVKRQVDEYLEFYRVAQEDFATARETEKPAAKRDLQLQPVGAGNRF
jgi:glycosyltransferase involved in cell wall biosynthesis